MATPGASSRACGNSPAVGNLHLHLDTVNEIELCGGERVFVYGTPGLSSPWPALTVPKALIPLPKFDAAKNRTVYFLMKALPFCMIMKPPISTVEVTIKALPTVLKA